MRSHVFYQDGPWRYVVSAATEAPDSSLIVEVFCGGRLDITLVVGRSHLLLAVMTHIAQRLFDAAGVTPRKGNQKFQ